MGKRIAETWEDEVRRDQDVLSCRKVLRMILEERFRTLPETVLQHIAACQDAERLAAWTREALRINSLDELRLE